VIKEAEKLGKNLKRIRTEKGISQVDIAKSLEVSRGFVSNLENGKTNPTLSTMARVANALSVTTVELLEEVEIDIFENDILKKYPGVLDILLRDQTTGRNIFWATDNYQRLGDLFMSSSPIESELITGQNGRVIMPRVSKNKALQDSRIKDMAEVYTPSWICNAQNNQIDSVWLEKEDTFNKEIRLSDGTCSWKVTSKKIVFPTGKSWKDYVERKCLEIACGEGPYLTSRYDAVTGEFIPVTERIGLFDRKLRVINENLDSPGKWLDGALAAIRSIYAYEWQGDSLLLAREALLYTFIENYLLRFAKKPPLESIKEVAHIISWNIWQMDGLKGIVPNSCFSNKLEAINLFNETESNTIDCPGCINDALANHSGIYCLIKDWSNVSGHEIRFMDLARS